MVDAYDAARLMMLRVISMSSRRFGARLLSVTWCSVGGYRRRRAPWARRLSAARERGLSVGMVAAGTSRRGASAVGACWSKKARCRV